MNFPELGVGIIYVPGLEPLLESGDSLVDAIEIEPQTFWNYNKDSKIPYLFPEQALKHIQSLPQPKIVHSVGFAIGGTHQPEPAFVDALTNSIESLDAVWASEHLSFTHVGSADHNFHTGFMLPPLQTVDGALTAAETIRSLSSQLPVPFAVETAVNYLKPRKGELSDAEFVGLTVEKADCGILLDLHNIWTNELNGRQAVKDYLVSIPLDRVWEIHLGGGFEMDGYWLDAHSGSVPEPVLELTRELIPALPNLKAVMYEIFPSYVPLFGIDAIQKQIEDIKKVWTSSRNNKQKQQHNQSINHIQTDKEPAGVTRIKPYQWEKALGELVTGGVTDTQLARELRQDGCIPLLRKLIEKFRSGSIVKTLTLLSRLILLHAGKDLFDELLEGYFKQTKPQPFSSEECYGFIEYLRQLNPDIPYLEDILAYEEATIWANINQKTTSVIFQYDPRELLAAIVNGEIPKETNTGAFELLVQPEDYQNEQGVPTKVNLN